VVIEQGTAEFILGGRNSAPPAASLSRSSRPRAGSQDLRRAARAREFDNTS
jgi:hypothetical protein